jgi:hypothetical protein
MARWVPRQGLEYDCYHCGWSGQPVEEMWSKGEVFVRMCESDDDCQTAQALAAWLEELRAQGRTDEVVGGLECA